MRNNELLFRLLRIPIEAILVGVAFYVAREIRLVTDLIPGVQLPIQRISESALALFAVSAAVLYVGVFAVSGLYRFRTTNSWGEEFLRIVSASFSWFLYYVALVYLSVGYFFQTEIPRLIIFFAFFLSIFAVGIERFLFSKIQMMLLRFGFLPKRRVLVLTESSNSVVLSEIQKNPWYHLVGYGNSQIVPALKAITHFSNVEEIADICRMHGVDEILVLDSQFSREEIDRIFDFAKTYAVSYRYADRFLLSESRETDISFIAGVPVVEVVNIGLGDWGRITKRIFDLIASIILIGVLSPILVIITLAIFLSDGHAPIYRSIRVGRFWESFSMYKFRSMRPGADALKKKLLAKNEREGGPLFKIENDPRITPVGKILRRFDLDELPQLLNVFLGNMSLVGPRPHLPEEVVRYEESQKRVLALKPGITGMAQVNGRHRNSFEDEVRLDVFYIEHWSLFLDLKILLKTISVVVSRGGR